MKFLLKIFLVVGFRLKTISKSEKKIAQILIKKKSINQFNKYHQYMIGIIFCINLIFKIFKI